jgi:CreA protein
MFTERISLVFRKLRVVRMVDARRNSLVYLTHSDRVIEGSPQNSVSAVAVDVANRIPVR